MHAACAVWCGRWAAGRACAVGEEEGHRRAGWPATRADGTWCKVQGGGGGGVVMRGVAAGAWCEVRERGEARAASAAMVHSATSRAHAPVVRRLSSHPPRAPAPCSHSPVQ